MTTVTSTGWLRCSDTVRNSRPCSDTVLNWLPVPAGRKGNCSPPCALTSRPSGVYTAKKLDSLRSNISALVSAGVSASAAPSGEARMLAARA